MNEPITPVAEPVVEPTSVVNSDGTFAKNWYVDHDKADHPTLSRFKNVTDLSKSYMSMRNKFGQDGKDPDSLIQIPKADSSDEVKAAFHKAGGELDTPEDYIKGFKKSKDISAKVEMSDPQLKNFAEIAKGQHLSKAQFDGIVNGYLMSMGKDIEAYDGEQAESKLLAKKEGNAVLNKVFRGDAATRKVRANGLLDQYGLEVIKFPDGSQGTIKGMLLEANPELIESPYFIMLLDGIAEKMSPDTLKGNVGSTVPTSAQVDSKITEVRTEMDKVMKENPVNFKNNPRFKELELRKHQLYESKKDKKPA